TLDRNVFAYLAALCAGSAFVCGLVPAWQASRPNLVATLNDAARGSVGGRTRRRWMGTFVVAQVALALVLLTGGALMMQNLVGLVRTAAGGATRAVAAMAFDPRRRDYDRERRLVLLGQLEERLASGGGIQPALPTGAPTGGGAPPTLSSAW